MLRHPFWKALSLYLAAAVLALSFPAPGWAMLVPAEREALRSADLATVQAALESAIIRQRLVDHGLSPEEASARISTLSDEELHRFAANIDAVQAGGSLLGDVVVVLLIIVLVIAILEMTGNRVIVRH